MPIIVVKIGGSTLGNHDNSLENLIELARNGWEPVVVHGGGNLASEWVGALGKRPRFVRGLRVTDAKTLELVTAVLCGVVNKQLVATLNNKGGSSVGISGADGGLFQAETIDPELGFVGKIAQVDTRPVLTLLKANYIPIIASSSIHLNPDPSSSLPLLNINADTAAGELAKALSAKRLVFLTDVPGVMDTSNRLIPRLTVAQVRSLINSKTITGGMIPKLEASLIALNKVQSCHIIDGRRPNALLECVEAREPGTLIC